MPVYLDYNATAPLRPEVQTAMAEILAEPANASSVHSFGRHAKKQLEDARKTIAESISAFPNDIIFMGCGTEANATALRGFPGRRMIVSAIEHSSILRSPLEGEQMSSSPKGAEQIVGGIIPVKGDGIIDLEALEAMLDTPHLDPPPQGGRKTLVSIMLANNETGVIQPIKDAAEICHKHGALLHTDAIQALGKIPVEFAGLGADMMSISAHKMGGPVGAAALVVRQDLAIKPLLTGGGQELGRRAGTENIVAICGFARAVELIDFTQMAQLRGWLDVMENTLREQGGLILPTTNHQAPSTRLPNTSCIAMPGVSNEVQLMDADLKGFAISAGSACSSGRIEASHVLQAMGLEKAITTSAIRVSAGWGTTEADIKSFTEWWLATRQRL